MQSSHASSWSAVLAAALLVSTCLVLGSLDRVGAGQGDCSQPVSAGNEPNTSDCLFILQSAVELRSCALCICDTDGSEVMSASDALRCLKRAVSGDEVTLSCPSCQPVSTTSSTTEGELGSTTSSSTSSTTTTIPQPCNNDGDCVDFPGSRCNPNTDICELPCNEDDDCNFFYECDLDTNFCVEPERR